MRIIGRDFLLRLCYYGNYFVTFYWVISNDHQQYKIHFLVNKNENKTQNLVPVILTATLKCLETLEEFIDTKSPSLLPSFV